MIKKIEVIGSLPNEDWVLYFDRKVSSFGRYVKLDPHGNEICIKYGLPRQRITVNGKLERLYRIIATVWIPKTEEDILLGRNFIDHIDNNVNNNTVQNLRWCTPQENSNNPITKQHAKVVHKGKNLSAETKKKISENNSRYWLGKTFSIETRKKISEAKKGKQAGSKNPSFGKIWWTNGESNLYLKDGEIPPCGYYRGMTRSKCKK